MHCSVLPGCSDLASHIRVIVRHSTKDRENYFYCILEIGLFFGDGHVRIPLKSWDSTSIFCACCVCVHGSFRLDPILFVDFVPVGCSFWPVGCYLSVRCVPDKLLVVLSCLGYHSSYFMLTFLNRCFGRTYRRSWQCFLGIQIFKSSALTLHLLFASIIHLYGLCFTILGPRLFLPSLFWFCHHPSFSDCIIIIYRLSNTLIICVTVNL